MTCRQVVELMTDYLDGALSAADRARFEEHIAGCDGCMRTWPSQDHPGSRGQARRRVDSQDRGRRAGQSIPELEGRVHLDPSDMLDDHQHGGHN